MKPRYSLLTLMCVSCVASALIFLNFSSARQCESARGYGWPITCYYDDATRDYITADRYMKQVGPGFEFIGLTFNIITGIIILLPAGLICEYLVRRRTKTATDNGPRTTDHGPLAMPKRILSGVQSSGRVHLGNYFGAIKQHIALQEIPDAERFYFIADFHALTTVQDPAVMRQNTRDVAIDYLALGLDPAKSTFFKQSDVPEVHELAWLLSTVTGMGLLERAHSYKDKLAKGIKPNVGLFYYPVLMAADILAYKSHLVPVGQDQVQHIEMTQDMAGHFNTTYKTNVFVYPEPKLSTTPKVPGTDGEKMSKSYGNTIDIQSDEKELKKVIMSIKTDSTPVESPKNPDTDNIFALYTLFATDEERTALAARYRVGGMGFGDAKKMLLEKVITYFADYRKKRAELVANPKYVDDVLHDGAGRARVVARATLDEARKVCGLA